MLPSVAALGRRHLPNLSAEGRWCAAPGYARESAPVARAEVGLYFEEGPPSPSSAAGTSSPCTRSFLDPRGSTSAIFASLKSDKQTKKVCKGPPFPSPLSFCQAVAFGHPPSPEPCAHPSTASPALRGSPDLSPEIQKPRQSEFPSRLWDSEPGRTREPEGDTEQVESCPFVTGDLAAQG